MLLDNNLIFDSNAAITTTRDSTNIIDLVNARDIGDGEELEVLIQAGTTALASTATTTTIQAMVMVSTDNSTYTTAAMSTSVAIGSLTTGSTILNIHMPMRRLVNPVAGTVGNGPYPRYIKLNYVASATLSAGTLTAALIGARQTNPAAGYPSGFTVNN